MKCFTLLFSILTLCTYTPFATADIIQVGEDAFHASAGQITFSESPLGTTNPVYTPALYGGGMGAPTVTFGGFFLGQSLGTVGTCPSGAALTGCIVGSPTGILSLDPKSPKTFIAVDAAQPTSPVLSGFPLYNGPVSMVFSTPQAGVGLIGGYFDALGSTAITAFDINGNVLGTLSNSELGDEFLGLMTSDGSATISGLQFHLVGDEPAGFDVDNIRFGIGNQVSVPAAVTPEPTSFVLLGTSLLSIPAARRRKFIQ